MFSVNLATLARALGHCDWLCRSSAILGHGQPRQLTPRGPLKSFRHRKAWRSCLHEFNKMAWRAPLVYLTLNGSCTLCGGFAAFEEAPVTVTAYAPAWVPVCDGPPPPLLVVPPLQEIIPVASAIRTAAESTCIGRSEGVDAEGFRIAGSWQAPQLLHSAVAGPDESPNAPRAAGRADYLLCIVYRIRLTAGISWQSS